MTKLIFLALLSTFVLIQIVRMCDANVLRKRSVDATEPENNKNEDMDEMGTLAIYDGNREDLEKGGKKVIQLLCDFDTNIKFVKLSTGALASLAG